MTYHILKMAIRKVCRIWITAYAEKKDSDYFTCWKTVVAVAIAKTRNGPD